MPNDAFAAVTNTPDGLRIALRPAVAPADDLFLVGVYDSTRTDLDAVAWDWQRRRDFVTMQFEAQRREYLARFPDSAHSVILLDDVPVGRMWVERGSAEYRLVDIAVLPEHRGKGVGSHLIRQLICEADVARLPLRHMVLRDNADARRFYERLGFAVVGGIDTHYLMEYARLK